jgi:hypothetical protein
MRDDVLQQEEGGGIFANMCKYLATSVQKISIAEFL